MTTRHSCGTEHSDALATALCTVQAETQRQLLAYAATLDQPPHPAHVLDLWAHARTLRDDGRAAAVWVRHVLDLGWRKEVGR